MTNLKFLWIPFSRKGKEIKSSAKEDLEQARQIYKKAQANRERYQDQYREQKELSDALRKEQRRNHFSELFQAVPLREDK